MSCHTGAALARTHDRSCAIRWSRVSATTCAACSPRQRGHEQLGVMTSIGNHHSRMRRLRRRACRGRHGRRQTVGPLRSRTIHASRGRRVSPLVATTGDGTTSPGRYLARPRASICSKVAHSWSTRRLFGHAPRRSPVTDVDEAPFFGQRARLLRSIPYAGSATRARLVWRENPIRRRTPGHAPRGGRSWRSAPPASLHRSRDRSRSQAFKSCPSFSNTGSGPV